MISSLRNRIESLSAEERMLLLHKLSEQNLFASKTGISESSKRLKAFVTTDGNLDTEALKFYLKSRLPVYMIPSQIVEIDIIPTLPNGKVDTDALRSYGQPSEKEKESVPKKPANEIQQRLLEIWKEVLKLDFIGIHDNFFEIGGDSISSILIIAKARKSNINLSPNQLFDYQTINELAQYVTSNEEQEEKWDYLVGLRNEGTKNPLFCIHAGGGHVFFYNYLTDHIDRNRPLYAIQPSGLYGPHGMHENVRQMTSDYIKAIRSVQPEGPYNVLVYCFSAAVGHEMGIQMQESGLNFNLIVADTMAEPWSLNTSRRLKIRIKIFLKKIFTRPYKTIRDMIVQRAWYFNLLRRKIFGNRDERLLAKLQSNLGRICHEYQWKPYSGKVNLILTEKPHERLNEEIIRSWKYFAQGGVRVIHTKGDHRNLFEKTAVPLIAEKIEQCIIE
jgi:thioesterase domain-containing protein/acyl carrier protein